MRRQEQNVVTQMHPNVLVYTPGRDLACTHRISKDWTEAMSREYACNPSTGEAKVEEL